MPLTSLVARTYLRYVVPVLVMSALVFAPLLYLALRVPVPADPAQVKGVLRTGWLLVAMALVPMLVLVGGVAPLVRAIASGAPLRQISALRAGIVGLARAVLPCAAAMLAIALGTLALAIPGLVLLVLLAPAGAAAAPGRSIGDTLAHAAAAARARLPAVAAIVLGAIAIAYGALWMLQRGLPLPLPKQPSPEMYAAFRLFARYAVAGTALVAPLPAIALAALTAGSPSARA